jgi:type IV secretory pathway VirD2 relaxase
MAGTRGHRMAQDDGFEIWLGRIGQDRPLRHQLSQMRARSGPRKGSRRSFTGARIGRGSRAGALLATRNFAFTRRAVVKVRIARLGTKGLRAAKAHLRYLERDGTTRDGGRGAFYGAREDEIDAKTLLERGTGDRHQFRFIVAPEDGARYDDLKPLIRSLMRRAAEDLGTRLDWAAVDHFNTGHPHAHVVVRGKDDLGRDLVIARNYLSHGLRERAKELVEIQLGPRTEAEILQSRRNEIGQERFTDIDRRLLASVDDRGLIRAVHSNAIEQSLRAGRLQALGRIGLAMEVERGLWKLDARLEGMLRRMGEVGDITRTMQRSMRAKLPERGPADMLIYDPRHAPSGPLVGRVVERGLSDEHGDRHYLIVDAVDGLARYVDIGIYTETIPENGIVRITPTPVAARPADVTVAEVAAAYRGRYSAYLHQVHDPRASEDFAQRHVRRLEVIGRTTGGVEREGDGTWNIAPDHLERAEAYERALAARTPVVIETVSSQPLATLPAHDGATWLDRELLSEQRTALGRGFGVDVQKALVARQQWLVEQGLVEEIDGQTILIRRDMIATLQQRELRRMAAQMSQELGLSYVESRPGMAVEGKLTRGLEVGDTKFALIEQSREFTLVPWRPVLERAIGKQVSGIQRESGIDWTIGRQRGLNIGM